MLQTEREIKHMSENRARCVYVFLFGSNNARENINYMFDSKSVRERVSMFVSSRVGGVVSVSLIAVNSARESIC